MVILNKIYTKTGDSGETALGNGARVAKFSLRVEAYGTVDELNSYVGISRLHSEGKMDEALKSIQNDLFDLGADLCRPNFEKDQFELPASAVTKKLIHALESKSPKACSYVTTSTYLAAFLKRILPTKFMDRILAKA